MSYSEEDLLDQIRSLAEELGRTPTREEVDEMGKYPVYGYQRYFGSYRKALDFTDLDPPTKGPEEITEEEMLDDLRRVADKVGHVPSVKEYRVKGNHSDKTFFDHFGSWQDTQEAAGFDSNDPVREISKDELLEEIQRLADELGHRPSSTEMNQQGRFWKSTYQDHFGTWSAAVEEAGFDASTSRKQISDEEIYEDIRRVAADLEKTPSLSDMEHHGKYSEPTYSRPCGTWTETREEALE